MTFGSLFAGIGGMDLGLERAGMECRWQVEIDPFCRKVLAKHWPDVKRYEDVRTVDWAEVERVDLIAGGFPCQDISLAGDGAGIDGARSGLWSEFARAVGDLRPRFVLVENVSALLGRGFGRVLGDLAERGYDAEWAVLPASAFGALHIRARVFVVAYPERGRRNRLHEREQARHVEADASERGDSRADRTSAADPARVVADAERDGLEGSVQESDRGQAGVSIFSGRAAARGISEARGRGWLPEPDVGRVVNGIPPPMDELRGLGNAVVPQVAEWIGRRILATA